MPIIVASSTSYCLITLMLTSPVSKRDSRVFKATNWTCVVEEGDRIAQLVIERIDSPSVVEVDVCVVQIPASIPFASLTYISGSRGNTPWCGWIRFDWWAWGSLVHC